MALKEIGHASCMACSTWNQRPAYLRKFHSCMWTQRTTLGSHQQRILALPGLAIHRDACSKGGSWSGRYFITGLKADEERAGHLCPAAPCRR